MIEGNTAERLRPKDKLLMKVIATFWLGERLLSFSTDYIRCDHKDQIRDNQIFHGHHLLSGGLAQPLTT